MTTSAPAFRITLVTESDFDELAELRIAAMRESLERVGRFDPERARERLRSTFQPADTRFILVDAERAGFYAVSIGADGWKLEHLYVHPRFQNLGLGSAVLRRILDDTDALGVRVHVVALKESASNRFYERHGFALVNESEWDNHYTRLPA
jgi:GNAT superfamily N-acetyltransferase